MKIIVAIDNKGGIGKDGRIPWNCPEDQQFFRLLTWGSNVIMGRKTFDSLKGPLKGRDNYVMTRQGVSRDFSVGENYNSTFYKDKGVHYFCNFGELIYRLYMRNPSTPSFIIGGESIYKLALPYTRTIYLSRIPGDYNCDRFFEVPSEFEMVTSVKTAACTYERYEKRKVYC